MAIVNMHSFDLIGYRRAVGTRGGMPETKPTFARKFKNVKNKIIDFRHATFQKGNVKKTRSLGRVIIDSLKGPKGKGGLFSREVKDTRQVIKKLCKKPSSEIDIPKNKFAKALFDFLGEELVRPDDRKCREVIIEGIVVTLLNNGEEGHELNFNDYPYNIPYTITVDATAKLIKKIGEYKRDAEKQTLQDKQIDNTALHNKVKDPSDNSVAARLEVIRHVSSERPNEQPVPVFNDVKELRHINLGVELNGTSII
jgi:hypothetical protein